MKKILLPTVILIAFLTFISCKNSTENKSQSDNKFAAVAKTETATFTISGMSCAVMCASKIEKELSGLKGVQKAVVDFDKKLATVKYDSAQISPEKLVQTVEAVAGGELYKVSNMKCSANKASLFQEKEKTRKERRAERKAKKESDAAATSTTVEAKPAKSGCCSGKKVCGKEEKAATM